MRIGTSRRRFLALLAVASSGGLLAACQQAAPPSPTSAPAAQPTTPPAQPTAAPAAPTQAATTAPAAASSGAAWDQIVEGAKKEGVLTAATNVGTGQQQFMLQFKEKYPWVELQHATFKASDLAPRILSEQRNGLYAWDWQVGTGFNTVGSVLGPANAVADMKPLVDDLPAEVKDEKVWAGGFELWRDPATRDALITQFNLSGGYYVNRDNIPEGELTSYVQLIDPKWAGKIVIYNPTQTTGAATDLAPMLANKGEDFIRKIIVDQKAVITETNQQATEWALTGRYPIGIGLDDAVIQDFQKQGVGKGLKEVREVEASYLRATGLVALKNPPHPNMARLFLHWFLSAEGQDAWARLSAPNATSRRFDVKVYNAEVMPDLSRIRDYKLVTGTKDGEALVQKVVEVVNKK